MSMKDTSRYQDEPFFTTATTGEKRDWRLVGNGVLPGSNEQNFLAQTAAIAEEVKRVFASREMPSAYQRAIVEFEAKRDELAALMDRDWREAAKQLAVLPLNQLCRESPVCTFYRLVIYEAVNEARLLQGVYHWTPSLSLRGELVGVGRFG